MRININMCLYQGDDFSSGTDAWAERWVYPPFFRTDRCLSQWFTCLNSPPPHTGAESSQYSRRQALPFCGEGKLTQLRKLSFSTSESSWDEQESSFSVTRLLGKQMIRRVQTSNLVNLHPCIEILWYFFAMCPAWFLKVAFFFPVKRLFKSLIYYCRIGRRSNFNFFEL